MNNKPFTVKFALILVLINALVWLVFGVLVVAGLHPALPEEVYFKWGMTVLSFAAAGVMTALFLLLKKRIRWGWYAAVAALAVSSVLTIFDDVGWIDLAVLVVMLVPLILLIKDRKWYLQKSDSQQGQE